MRHVTTLAQAPTTPAAALEGAFTFKNVFIAVGIFGAVWAGLYGLSAFTSRYRLDEGAWWDECRARHSWRSCMKRAAAS